MKISPLKKYARPAYALKIAALLTAAASVAGCAEQAPSVTGGSAPVTEETQGAAAKVTVPVTDNTSKTEYTEETVLSGKIVVTEETELAGDVAPIEDTTAAVTAAAAVTAVTTAAGGAGLIGTSPATEDDIEECRLDGDVYIPEDDGLTLDGEIAEPEDYTVELDGVVAPDEARVDSLYGINSGSQLYDDLKETDYALRMVFSHLDNKRSYNLSYESGTTQYGFTCWRIVDNRTNALTTNFIAIIDDEDFEKQLKKDGAQRFGYVGGPAADNTGFYGYITKARVDGVGNANVAFLTIADPKDRPEEYAEFIVDALAAYGFFAVGVDEEEAVELDGDVAVEEDQPVYTKSQIEIFAENNADVLHKAFLNAGYAFVPTSPHDVDCEVWFTSDDGEDADEYGETAYYFVHIPNDKLYISFAKKGGGIEQALRQCRNAQKVTGGYVLDCTVRKEKVRTLYIIVDDFVDPISDTSAKLVVDGLIKKGVLK